MFNNDIIYGKGKNDECYTPACGVKPILEFVNPEWRVWCPFDTPESEYVKQLTAYGCTVIYSHLKYGQDFFEYEPDEYYDCIISNPPFTGKKKIFERAMRLKKPFALLMAITWLNDKAPKEIFGEEMQLLLLDKRLRFYTPEGTQMPSPTFSSAYFCRNFLPKPIVYRKVL